LHSFYMIDVFTDVILAGNPLVLVIDASDLDENVMRAIAREFNQSETTFLLPPTREGANFRLRSFTAHGHEVVGAGHNALGAWWWLATAGQLALRNGAGSFTQEIGDRVLKVEIVGKDGQPHTIWMDQAAPQFGQVVEDRLELAAALGLTADDFENSAAQVVSTGAPHLLVRVASRSAVNRARPDSDRLAAVLQTVNGQGCYLYCLEPVEADAIAHARFFNPTVGILEDPATGSAAGPLASQLVADGVVQDATTVVVEQGYSIQRPSCIQVAVHGDRVRVGGAAVVVAEGRMQI
jgi:trans-2,3-dihydro-3-hydroxyanthranilate isomerase